MPIVAITSDQRALSPKINSPRVRPSRPEIFLKKALVERVTKMGAIPIIIPPCRADITQYCQWLSSHVDGIIISGGAFDIDPRHYGETIEARIDRRDEERTDLELEIARFALENDLPILGICGGMQVLAVAAGGGLIQDISHHDASALEHEQPTDPAQSWHEIRTTGILREIYGKAKIGVNSTHHQAVRPSELYHTVGYTKDGIIEAISIEKHRFALGVQWHPELLRDTLFQHFIHVLESTQ